MRDDLEMLKLLECDHFVKLKESPIRIVDEDGTNTIVEVNDVISLKITAISTTVSIIEASIKAWAR